MDAGGADARETAEETAVSRIFEIGAMIDGRFTPVGKITFDADHEGRLALIGSGAGQEKLEAAWAEVSGAPSVTATRSEEVFDDAGNSTRRLYDVEVARTDPGYPNAVMDWLSWNHGLFAAEETPEDAPAE